MTKISIIVPIYNVEDYLANCIDSILGQTFESFELLLINDGSTDKSGEICDRYQSLDNRIKVIHKENGGVSSARNKGLEIAKGDYIGFVDPDDTIETTMYESLVNISLELGADIVSCSIKTTNLNTNQVYTTKSWKKSNCLLNRDDIENEIIPSLLQNKTFGLVSVNNKLYKKCLFFNPVVLFEDKKQHSEDLRLNIYLINKINNLCFLDEPLYNYYIHKRDSLSQKFKKNLYEYIVDNKILMIKLSEKYNKVSLKNHIKEHYTRVTLNHISDVVMSDLLSKEKIAVINNIINDNLFREDIKLFKSKNLFLRIIIILCRFNQVSLIYYLILIKSMIKRIYKENTMINKNIQKVD